MAEQKKAQFNKSNCKKFMSETGMNVKPDAVMKFKVMVEQYAVEQAKILADKTTARNAKTISIEDFE